LLTINKTKECNNLRNFTVNKNTGLLTYWAKGPSPLANLGLVPIIFFSNSTFPFASFRKIGNFDWVKGILIPSFQPLKGPSLVDPWKLLFF